MNAALLEVGGLTARYGQITALHSVELSVAPGEAVALVGANGAGKSTLMKCVMGMLAGASGVVRFAGNDLTQRPVSARARIGIGYAPEGRRIFAGLTVHENLLVASPDRDNGRARAQEVYEFFPALQAKSHAMGWSLSGGQQQMLAIGRALMTRPRLLLLDEPSLGLSPLLMNEVLDRVAAISAAGTAVLLAEQNVHKALMVTRRAYVLKLGRVLH
ncbi:MAG: ABC transporter ATP-binding protein, partial [Comamonadaceae bacterium]|nr:ABC transporter ATP-binding protein [Comamonadaceae bacterium]